VTLGRPAGVSDPTPDLALRALFEEGARSFPGIPLAVEAFVAHLAARASGELPPAGRGADLYLACACAARAPGALEAFERTQLAQVGAHIARLRPTPAFVDEVRQEVRDKLYVGKDGAPPKIAEYDGRGALVSWVRVVAMRAAIDLRRRAGVAAGPDDRARDAPAAGDPERDYQKEQILRAFDEAIRGAAAALDGEQRRLLRRHFAEGITLDALAAERGVHRATVARKLAAARAALRKDARRRLKDALGLGDAELDGVASWMRSRLDLSLRTLLRSG
jgi:RNA polymerase sigma-70 factor (ECF subfamily)